MTTNSHSDTGIETGATAEEKAIPPSWAPDLLPKMRQIYPQRFDIPIATLQSMVDSKLIDLAPGFQRRLRWSRKQKSRLIESVIMNVPIPPVFMGEEVPGRWVVLDGRQRLTALYEFLTNEFKLTGLDVWSELNGKSYRQLSKFYAEEPGRPGVKVTLDVAVTRRFLPAIVVLHESSPEVKYEVFDRLNTGGVIAEAMEVRNAIYRGRFNKLVHVVSDTAAFRTLWGIPLEDDRRERNAAYKKMVDLEMALRFFAMERYKEFRGRLKDFLTAIMAEMDPMDQDVLDTCKERFITAHKNALCAFGDDAFQRILDSGTRSPIRSAPLADAVLFAMAGIDSKTAVRDAAFYRTTLDNLCRRDLKFQKAISVGTNSTTATQYRIDAAFAALVTRVPVQDVPVDPGFEQALAASEASAESADDEG